MSADKLVALVSTVYSHTVSLANANAVDVSDLVQPSISEAGNAIDNLCSYFKAQQHIFQQAS